MVADLKLAITGGTGFVGGRLIDLALSAGHEVRALTRRDQSPRDGVTWIRGALDDQVSLDDLAEGADAVIHVAGVINAPHPAECSSIAKSASSRQPDCLGFPTSNISLALDERWTGPLRHVMCARWFGLSPVPRRPSLCCFVRYVDRGDSSTAEVLLSN